MHFHRPKIGKRPCLLAYAALYALGASALAVALPVLPRTSIAMPWQADDVLISRDGSTLVATFLDWATAAICNIGVWDLRTGERKINESGIPGRIGDPHMRSRSLERSFHPIDISPDGSLVAAIISGKVEIWDTRGRQRLKSLIQSTSPLLGGCHLRFSPDGNTLAFTSSHQGKNSITIWDVPTRSERYSIPGQSDRFVFSPDSRALASTTAFRNVGVRLLDAYSGNEVVSLEEPAYGETLDDTAPSPFQMALAFSGDGSVLGMYAKLEPRQLTLKYRPVLDRTTCVSAIWDTGTGKIRAQRLWRNASAVFDDTANCDGVFIAPRNRREVDSTLLDPITGDLRQTFATGGLNSSCQDLGTFDFFAGRYGHAPSPEGRFVALKKYVPQYKPLPAPQWTKFVPFWTWNPPESMYTVELHELETALVRATLPDQVFACFSPDGRMLATQSSPYKMVNGMSELDDSHVIYIWDVPPGRPWLFILGGAAIPLALCALVRRGMLMPAPRVL